MSINSNYDDNAVVRIKSVGDIAAGDYSIHGLGVCAISRKYDAGYLFGNLQGLLNNKDILIGNLEGPLSKRAYNEDMRLCGIPEIASELKILGFDVLSVANNHIFDHGLSVFNETIAYCNDAGIKICGLRSKSDYYSEPVILEKKSLRIGLLAYNYIGLERMTDVDEHIAVVRDSVVNYTWNRDSENDRDARRNIDQSNKNVISDIKLLRKDVDIVIIMPHWGYEWGILPPYGVTQEAKLFLDSGADVIIGSHPHVIQGLEEVDSKLIAYSLGNFLFDSTRKKFDTGMIIDCKVNEHGVLGYDMNFVKRGVNFRPEPASGKDLLNSRHMIKSSNEIISSSNKEDLLDDDLIYNEYERQYKKMKFHKVIFLLVNLFKHPRLLLPIIGKIKTLLYIIKERIKGNKIRW